MNSSPGTAKPSSSKTIRCCWSGPMTTTSASPMSARTMDSHSATVRSATITSPAPGTEPASISPTETPCACRPPNRLWPTQFKLPTTASWPGLPPPMTPTRNPTQSRPTTKPASRTPMPIPPTTRRLLRVRSKPHRHPIPTMPVPTWTQLLANPKPSTRLRCSKHSRKSSTRN